MIAVLLDILKIGVQQYGALFAVVGFVCFILWYALKWIRSTQKDVVDQSVKREEAQRGIIKEQQRAVSDLAKEVKSMRRAHTRDHAKMAQGLTEVTKALGRINGYKNHKEDSHGNSR